MLSKTDQAQLTAWAIRQTRSHTIFLSDTPHPEQPVFETFASDLARAAPCIRIRPSDRKTSLPTLFVSGNIGFCALPMERELAPFLDALSWLTGPLPPVPDDLALLLEQVDPPCRLTLFIAPGCPHCPHMVRTLIPMAIHSRQVILEIIDGSLFPESALKHRVTSAPCLIADQDFRWTGQADPGEILPLIMAPDLSRPGADALRQLLEQGNADWLSRKMVQAGAVFENLSALLLHPVWSVRLGAMVVVETLAQEAPELAAHLCPPLIHAFDDMDVTVQGDILYALGEAGTPDTRTWISRLLPRLSHPDLVDAAREAMAVIEARG